MHFLSTAVLLLLAPLALASPAPLPQKGILVPDPTIDIPTISFTKFPKPWPPVTHTQTVTWTKYPCPPVTATQTVTHTWVPWPTFTVIDPTLTIGPLPTKILPTKIFPPKGPGNIHTLIP